MELDTLNNSLFIPFVTEVLQISIKLRICNKISINKQIYHRYLSVWKTVPSEARVSRDELSGDKNAKTAVWKTVPNYEL